MDNNSNTNNTHADINLDRDNSLGYDFSSIVRVPFYFSVEHDAKSEELFAYLHCVKNESHSDVGVVICPSLGVEYMNAFRPLRYVADHFAKSGFPTLRFDYYATGDSSGVNDEINHLGNWLANIKEACSQLKRISGCTHIVLFGFRIGATLAALAAEKLEVDSLILWAALENGRRYIREIKALQMTATSQVGVDAPQFIEAGGAVFAPGIVSEIEKIKLTNCNPRVKRVLLIPRDDLPSSEKLKNAWEHHGIIVNQISMPGYSGMVLNAHNVIVPHKSIEQIVSWVKDELVQGGNLVKEPHKLASLKSSISIKHYNGCLDEPEDAADKVNESIVLYGPDKSRIAILTTPRIEDDINRPIVILANSGANHRVGPNRLYVLLARELSRKGFMCLRIDIAGLGDSAKNNPSDENVVYIDDSSEEILLAIQSFGKDYLERRYVLMGLCSGSYFSFHAAKDLDGINIAESLLVNPLTFYWEEGMSLDVSTTKNFSQWNWYKKALKDPASWLKLLKGRIAFKLLISTLVERIKIVFTSKLKERATQHKISASEKPKKNLSYDLNHIVSKNTHISFVFARSDPGYDILFTSAGRTAKKLLKKKKMDIYIIDNADHTFSKYYPRCKALNTIVMHLDKRYNKI